MSHQNRWKRLFSDEAYAILDALKLDGLCLYQPNHGFEVPFAATAIYFGMDDLGVTYQSVR